MNDTATKMAATGSDAVDLDKIRVEFEAQLSSRFSDWDKARDTLGRYTWSRAREEWAAIERSAALIAQARAAAPAPHAQAAVAILKAMRENRLNDMGVSVADIDAAIAALSQQPVQAAGDEYEDCPKCKGSRVLGEVRGIRCSNCEGTGMVHRAALAAKAAAAPVAGIHWSPSAGQWMLNIYADLPKIANKLYQFYAAPVSAAPMRAEDARDYPAVQLTRNTMGMCVVSLEIGGKWVPVIKDNGDIIGHIVEPLGIRLAIERAAMAAQQDSAQKGGA